MAWRSRLSLAWQALRGQVELADFDTEEYEDEEDDSESFDSDKPIRILGALHMAVCDVEPSDSIVCQPQENTEIDRRTVAIRFRTHGETESAVALNSTKARQFAAGILNAADAIDGLRPLFLDSTTAAPTQEPPEGLN